MKNRSYFLIPVITAVLATALPAAPTRWEISDGGNGHWYEAVLSPDINWTSANDAALARSGNWHLATITSQEENTFILSLFAGQSDFWGYRVTSSLVGPVYRGPWIGASSSSNSSNDWSWGTGEPWTYSAWGPYEPFRNGDKVFFSQFGSSRRIGWNDAPGRYLTTGYIVETGDLQAIPAPAGISLVVIGLAVVAARRRTRPQQ